MRKVIEVTQADGSIKKDISVTDPKTRIERKVEETVTTTSKEDAG